MAFVGMAVVTPLKAKSIEVAHLKLIKYFRHDFWPNVHGQIAVVLKDVLGLTHLVRHVLEKLELIACPWPHTLS